MGMAVDHAVGFREDVKKGVFDIQSKAGAMGQAYGKLAKSEKLPWGIAYARLLGTHVAMYGNYLYPLKNIKDRWGCHVAGMDNDIAALETVADLFFKTAVRANKMSYNFV